MDIEESEFEDSFKDANLYAGEAIDLARMLKEAPDKKNLEITLLGARFWYNSLFEAFIAGVKCEREKHKEK
jgi:myo-inositol-1-phosphate synthase